MKRKSNIGQRSIKNTTKRSKVLPLEDTRSHYNITADFTSTVCPWNECYLFISLHFCCNEGGVQLAALPRLPTPISDLLHKSHFLSNLRKYNNAFAMTYFGC